MLRRIRVAMDLFRDHLAQTRLLGKPGPCHAGDGVPSDIDRPLLTVDVWMARGDRVGLGTQAEGLLHLFLSFGQLDPSPVHASFPDGGVRVSFHISWPA